MGKLLWLVVGFLLLGGYLIYQASDYNLDDDSDRKSFAKTFGKWVVDLGKKTKNVVAFVIKEDWLPETENETNETITIELS